MEMNIDEKRAWTILASLLGFILIPVFFIGPEYFLAVILLVIVGSKLMPYTGIL